jgi:hypothetical protein
MQDLQEGTRLATHNGTSQHSNLPSIRKQKRFPTALKSLVAADSTIKTILIPLVSHARYGFVISSSSANFAVDQSCTIHLNARVCLRYACIRRQLIQMYPTKFC